MEVVRIAIHLVEEQSFSLFSIGFCSAFRPASHTSCPSPSTIEPKIKLKTKKMEAMLY